MAACRKVSGRERFTPSRANTRIVEVPRRLTSLLKRFSSRQGMRSSLVPTFSE